jgi:zinc D-Ala-D-Ala dipeptidase
MRKRENMRWSFAVLLAVSLAYTHFAVFVTQVPADGMPEAFVRIEEIIPNIQVDLRYFTDKNFLGRHVDGYLASRCLLAKEAAEALRKVQDELNRFGLGLKIYDAYRPQRAVNHFVRWGKDLDDTKMQTEYYPKIQKKDLFNEGYIAEKSSHSRGSTVDLTIVYMDKTPSESELDMGTCFDFFGPESWPESPLVSPVQRAHRMLLQVLMLKHGFEPYAKEWWHFTLKKEPFPETYFDFPVQ